MFRANASVIHLFRFFGSTHKNALRFVGKGQVVGCRDLFPNGQPPRDIVAKTIAREKHLPAETGGHVFVFAKYAKQQMLRLYGRAAKLAGLVSSEEDSASRSFRITFKHRFMPLFYRNRAPSCGGLGAV